MSIDQFIREAKEVAEIARKQADGQYTLQSDATTALKLIERLAESLSRIDCAECS